MVNVEGNLTFNIQNKQFKFPSTLASFTPCLMHYKRHISKLSALNTNCHILYISVAAHSKIFLTNNAICFTRS